MEGGEVVFGASRWRGSAGMAVGSQWYWCAARVCRAAVMMCLASPSRTMWRSVPNFSW